MLAPGDLESAGKQSFQEQVRLSPAELCIVRFAET